MANENGPAARVQVFYNASAGGHCNLRLAALNSGFAAHGAETILTECGPGIDIAIDEAASHVSVLGGDGTVRHVASALAKHGRQLPLSIYPTGTVNLLHRELRFPTDPRQHAARLLGNIPGTQHYAATVNGSLFLACASVGPDSAAVASVSSGLKRRIGRAAYALSFLRVLVSWSRPTIKLEADGISVNCEAFYIANGRYFAGPWTFAPDASLEHPRLHVVALHRATRLDFFYYLVNVLRGRAASGPQITTFLCDSVTATAERRLPVQGDGDIVSTLPARFDIRAAPFLISPR